MIHTPVLIAGGGPVGMTLAHDLARRGVRSILVERNAATTLHPKMDITNGRSMELFRRAGLVDALRAVAVPESHPFDVSWVTRMSGHELHRFHYLSVDQERRRIREVNDGTQPREAQMRVSQVEIEPVLKHAIDADPEVNVRFGTEFIDMQQDAEGVMATVRRADDGQVETIRCQYLAGCDGGTSRVRECLGIELSGRTRIMPRFMTHFRSSAKELLQRWGIAWHYQSIHGTLIAQNDKDVWTLHSRFPEGKTPETVDPSALLMAFTGTPFDHQILVANHWSPHLLVANSYGSGRVWLAGDAAHQFIPTGAYGMNTGIGDAFDLSWKLAASVLGFGGPELLASYDFERRPVGLRNRKASAKHNDTRVQIAGLYSNQLFEENIEGAQTRARVSQQIATIGNAENECRGIEFGYIYENSPIVASEPNAIAPQDFVRYQLTTMPGSRLPSVFLADSSALYDRLGAWFTLLSFGEQDPSTWVAAAQKQGVPLDVVSLSEPSLERIYETPMILVRPDQHIAWRGSQMGDLHQAELLMRRFLGWIST
jgi:2-polyprenyl-6-methoxyphenol hydroxylase-like FAD-dependent oxidoreductase